MKKYQEQFINFCLQNKILNFGDFTLKSNRKSPYFFNLGKIDNGKELQQLAYFYSEKIKESNIQYDVLFGPAYKGIPIVTATAMVLQQQNLNSNYAFNRKEIKQHGEKGILIGSSIQNKKILIMDDVITAGTAIKEILPMVNENKATITGVIIALNREEKTSQENNTSIIQTLQEEFNIPVVSIISISDILEYLTKNNLFEQHRKSITDYLKVYQA